MEAASGAAGLLSLGIAVCQSLLDYYHSWKKAEGNVAKTYASIEELSKTLKLLAVAINSKDFNGDIVDQIRNSVESSTESLRNLERKLNKVRVVALQNGWKDKAKAQFRRTLYPFKESTLAKLRELSSEARDNLSLALNVLQIDASAVSSRKMDILVQQSSNISAGVNFLNQKFTSMSANVIDMVGSTRETAKRIEGFALNESSKELRAWLSGHYDPTQKQDETWRERHPDTGQWFLQSHKFRTGLEGPPKETQRVLNLIGKSGAGKTSLISSAIRPAQLMGRNDPQIVVAYFYCSFDEIASQDPVNMVGSFLSQVSTSCPNILEGLDMYFARKERPAIKELEQHFMNQTARSSLKALLFVDAVNECKKIEPMINTLRRLAQSRSDIRVLFTSTEEDPMITDLTRLTPPKATSLRMSALSADIDLFIDAKLKEKKNLRGLSFEKIEEIKLVLSSKAGGTFRWVQCQIEHLGNQPTGRLVDKALRELPPDLNSTYASILARIPRETQEFAKEAMLWLSFASRALRLTELCETLAFNESDTTVDPLDRLLDANDLLRWCQGLITYHPTTSHITLSHSSVRTYLVSDHIKHTPSSFFSIDENLVERLLFRKCLAYMMFTDFSKGYLPTYHEWKAFSRRWPLFDYASNYWASHAYTMGAALEPYDQGSISKLCNTSKNEQGGNFSFWVQCLCPKADIRVARITQPLYYAASFGLRAVVGSLISANKDLDLEALGGRHSGTALEVACYRGHYGVAKDLLHAGASPYCKDEFNRSALFYALCHDHADIAELLRESLRARTDPKGQTASEHIEEASAAARIYLAGRKRGDGL